MEMLQDSTESIAHRKFSVNIHYYFMSSHNLFFNGQTINRLFSQTPIEQDSRFSTLYPFYSLSFQQMFLKLTNGIIFFVGNIKKQDHNQSEVARMVMGIAAWFMIEGNGSIWSEKCCFSDTNTHRYIKVYYMEESLCCFCRTPERENQNHQIKLQAGKFQLSRNVDFNRGFKNEIGSLGRQLALSHQTCSDIDGMATCSGDMEQIQDIVGNSQTEDIP